MEPLDYVRIAKRWWWLILGLVLVAMAIVYAVTPARLVDEYEATHVLLVEAANDDTSATASNPEIVALWAKDTEVLERAAAELDIPVNRLRRTISVDTDRATSTVLITATDRNPDLAVLKANTVADQTVAFLIERESQRREQTLADLAESETSLRERIAVLDAQIALNPPDVATRTAERDSLIRQLGDVLRAQDLQGAEVVYTSLNPADRGVQQERLFGTQTRTQRMLLAGLVAALLGFGLAILLDRSDTRLRTRRSVEEHFGLPVVAEIVKFPLSSRHHQFVVSRNPDSPSAESFRTLRSALMLLAPPGREAATTTSNGHGQHTPAPKARASKVIMITSPSAAEGKTTTVANLAAAYVESQQSVLVLSFDRERPVGRKAKRHVDPGVSDYLAATAPPPLETLVRPAAVAGVFVVGSGGGALLGGRLDAQHRLLDEARSLADVVIIDTAPLLASSIAGELATMSDTVVVLCRLGQTTASEAQRCARLLQQIGAPTLGVVLVGVTAPTSSTLGVPVLIRTEDKAATKATPEVPERRPAEAP